MLPSSFSIDRKWFKKTKYFSDKIILTSVYSLMWNSVFCPRSHQGNVTVRIIKDRFVKEEKDWEISCFQILPYVINICNFCCPASHLVGILKTAFWVLQMFPFLLLSLVSFSWLWLCFSRRQATKSTLGHTDLLWVLHNLVHSVFLDFTLTIYKTFL